MFLFLINLEAKQLQIKRKGGTLLRSFERHFVVLELRTYVGDKQNLDFRRMIISDAVICRFLVKFRKSTRLNKL